MGMGAWRRAVLCHQMATSDVAMVVSLDGDGFAVGRNTGATDAHGDAWLRRGLA